MAQKESETGPSLELPSLFGRRKRRGEQSGDTATVQRAEEPAPVVPVDDRSDDATTVIEPVDSEPTTVVERVEPVREPEPTAPTAHTPAVTPTAIPSPTPTEVRSPAQAPAPAPAPAPVAQTPVAQRPVTQPPAPAAAPVSSGSSPAGVSTSVAGGPPTASSPGPSTPAKAAGGRRRARTSTRTLPDVAASTAAFLVGAIVGLAGCVLTYLGLQGCEFVTGTGSCGGPGLLILVVILVAMVLLGAAILRMLRVPDPGNISFLGVGMLTVVALVFLADYLYEPWMFVVVPAVTAVSYAIARWVTTLYAEDVLGDDDRMPRHDIR